MADILGTVKKVIQACLVLEEGCMMCLPTVLGDF